MLHWSRAVTRLAWCSWRSLDVDKFAEDSRQLVTVHSPPSDIDELFHCYNETLRSLVDIHAPLQMVNCRRGPRSARCYDGECRREKAKTRRLGTVLHLRHGASSVNSSVNCVDCRSGKQPSTGPQPSRRATVTQELCGLRSTHSLLSRHQHHLPASLQMNLQHTARRVTA